MSTASDAPTVVLENGDHAHVSRGDGAMLKATIDRIRALWPSARVAVVSSSPVRLRLIDPAVVCLPDASPGRWRTSTAVGEAWTPPSWALDLWWSATERWRFRYRAGRAARRLLRAAGFSRDAHASHARALRDARIRPQLTLAVGGGYLCDMDADRAIGVLDTLEWAREQGSATALMSQGVGPVTDGRLRTRMAQVLPQVDRIFLRERLTGPKILEQLGVAAGKVRVAGDDAILLAARVSAGVEQRGRIGVSLRSAAYLELAGEHHGWLFSAIAQAADRLATPVRPLTACEWGDEDRAPGRALRGLVRKLEPDLRRSAAPQAFADAIGTCRVVVTTTYHAAVFALSQGIPAVCVYRSAYQLSKFAGLAELFGGEGVTLADAGDEGDRRCILERILASWKAAETVGPGLRDKADGIREDLVASYEELRRLGEGA